MGTESAPPHGPPPPDGGAADPASGAPRPEAGLIGAWILDRQGGGRTTDWEGIRSWTPGDGILWVHLDYSRPEAVRWLREESGLDPLVVETMLLEDIRPRSLPTLRGLLVVLRAVNLNPGAHPEDMVAVRIWLEGERVITCRRRRLYSVEDVAQQVSEGMGPGTVGQFLVAVIDRILVRMADVVNEVEESVDTLEARVADGETSGIRPRISETRRDAIIMRRWLAPQREALSRIHAEAPPWITERERIHLRELADRTARYVEDLDTARDRATLVQEELANRVAEQTNARMYLLTIVATVFMPLSFVTGLLGMNVGGIPGAELKTGFWIVFGLLTGLALVALWALRRWRWL